jgi:hypothetical protein
VEALQRRKGKISLKKWKILLENKRPLLKNRQSCSKVKFPGDSVL